MISLLCAIFLLVPPSCFSLSCFSFRSRYAVMSAIYKRYDHATELLQRAVNANPYHTRSWYYLGLTYLYHKHKPRLARKYLLQAIKVLAGGSECSSASNLHGRKGFQRTARELFEGLRELHSDVRA